MIPDERYKQLMVDIGLPESMSAYHALKQVERESAHEAKQLLDQAIQAGKQLFSAWLAERSGRKSAQEHLSLAEMDQIRAQAEEAGEAIATLEAKRRAIW